MKLKYIIIFAIFIIGLFFFWQNNSIVITKYDCIKSKLPSQFNSFKIVHISDLHNKNFKGKLINKMKEISPDIVVITGDLIDRRRTNLDVAANFLEEAVKIAPTYYVSGNHEQLTEDFAELKEIIKELNVINMDDSYAVIDKDGGKIGISGIADPATKGKREDFSFEKNTNIMRSKLDNLSDDLVTDFNILLSHRPEQIELYKEFCFDLVFSGHAHGGQIRIPFVGGVLSPNQGFFPKYSEGMHTEESTSMIVSRGLGNSLFPFRIFNRPELIVVSLERM